MGGMDRPPDSRTAAAILHAYTAFSTRAGRIGFLSPVEYVYNPIQYCRAPFTEYVCRYATGRRRVLFLGMNPGPWGMAQTGVPFGEVGLVRDWLHIQETTVGHPAREHPRVPVRGFS